MTNLTLQQEFTPEYSDVSMSPHLFEVYKHSVNSVVWLETVSACLDVWRISADAYFDIRETGFAPERFLSLRGQARLPTTPPESQNITKNPYVTDITEVLALRLIKNRRPNAVFPYPRVLHKEHRNLQHHGIDILGFEETASGYILLIVEVMASVQNTYPASTVTDHRHQLLDETLRETPPNRLLTDLEYVQSECQDVAHKDILNGLITAIIASRLDPTDLHLAVAVLIRPLAMWNNRDLEPFINNVKDFVHAAMPASVWFLGIECDRSFSELLEHIKRSVMPSASQGN